MASAQPEITFNDVKIFLETIGFIKQGDQISETDLTPAKIMEFNEDVLDKKKTWKKNNQIKVHTMNYKKLNLIHLIIIKCF